jgi:hypothetical protein
MAVFSPLGAAVVRNLAFDSSGRLLQSSANPSRVSSGNLPGTALTPSAATEYGAGVCGVLCFPKIGVAAHAIDFA